MIIDQMDQASLYDPLVPGLKKAFEWLRSHQSGDLANGTHVIDGESIYAIVTTIEPKNLRDTRFETHRKYVDCHLILAGQEVVAYAPVSSLIAETEYDPEKDFIFHAGSGQMLTVDAGQFWIALPTDAHWPAIQTGSQLTVRKIIFKIALPDA